MNNIILSLIIVALVVVGVGAVVMTRLPEAPRAQLTIPDAPMEVKTENTAPAYRPDLTKESVYSEPILAPTVATTTKATAPSPKPVVPKVPAPTPKPVTISTTTVATTTIVGSTLLTPINPNTALSSPAVSQTTQPTLVPAGSASVWRPALNTKFQIQFLGSLDMSIDAEAYDVDLFDTPEETITALRAKGVRVICYISVGSWEDWRPDSATFPKMVIGRDYEGWPGENWLNISRIDILGPIMKARFDLAKSKGCDAIEPDNIDVYSVDSGFALSYAQQITYNKWLADEAHSRGLAIGLKNDIDQVSDLLSSFDFAITESCHYQGWCDQVKPFVLAGKPVFQIEYSEAQATLSAICPAAKQRGFNAFIKHRNLDAWVQRCL